MNKTEFTPQQTTTIPSPQPSKRQQKRQGKSLNSDDQKTTTTAQLTLKKDGETQASNGITHKISDITGVVSELNIDLSAYVVDLSSHAQEKFEAALEQHQQGVAAFQSIFSKNNRTYLAKKEQMDTSSVREHFYQLRETEKQQYQEIKNSYTKSQQVFADRIKGLTHAIADHLFESSLLEHTIIGNDSYYKSFSLLSLSMGYRYGATFRLWELTQAIENRRVAIGLKEKEEQSLEESMIGIIPASETCQKLANISRDIDILKEEVTICNEALKKEGIVVSTTDLPRQYHIYHRQRLDVIKDSFANLSEALDKQIKKLEEELKLEASTPESLKSFACQQELLEISTRKAKILERQAEVEDFLNQRKKSFNLVELGLDTKEPVKLADLSPQYNQALSLIGRITALKEDIVLSNNWEKFATSEQRRLIYFQIAQQTEELSKVKDKFNSEILPERKKMIDAAVAIYRSYIVNIQQSLEAIDSHFKLLEKDSLERANWQVSLTKKEKRIKTSEEENKVTKKSDLNESEKVSGDSAEAKI